MKDRFYYLWNIGCQMNLADARRVAEGLERQGYRPTRQPELASVMLLNTCVVRQSAEDKVTGRLSSLRSLASDEKKRSLLVMGCYVGDSAALEARFPFVDGFFQPSDIEGILSFVAERDAASQLACRLDDPITPLAVSEYVPISYGCDHHCTYCIVTIRRGDLRSRPVAEIVDDVQDLVRRGVREITLLGQNVDAYGSDLADRADLADILMAIHDIDDLWRIRFLTSHPQEMSQRIIDTVGALPKVCECWELAVQSGDNDVLRRMARGYSIERFTDLIGRIRMSTPGCGLNTDIIVGFPGETEAQFENTMRLVRETRFDMVHVASYSPRPGTVSATWVDDVSPEEKERRRVLVDETQAIIAGELNAELLGQSVEILVEGKKKGRWYGRTRTGKLVFFAHDADWAGQLVQVRLNWTGPWSLIGEVNQASR